MTAFIWRLDIGGASPGDEVADQSDFQLRVFHDDGWVGRWEITRVSVSGARGIVAKGWGEGSIEAAKQRAETVYEALTKRL